MTTYSFDPQDPKVRSFLIDFIGLPEEVVGDGKLSGLESIRHDISEALWTVAGTDCFISPAEAQRALDLVHTYGKPAIHALFKTNKCPGRSVSASQAIMGNLLGANEEIRLLGTIFPEFLCNFEQMEPYGLLNLRGVHFLKQTAPKSIAAFGPAVIHIELLDGKVKKGGGSAVIISEDGHLLTARHVLYQVAARDVEHLEFKEFHQNLYITIENTQIPIKKDQIVWEEDGKDIVLLKIPALAGRSHLKIAHLPPLPGEIVWFIGFPMSSTETFRGTRSFTSGEIMNLYGDGLIHMETSARVAHGYSGGAMINGRGELLGISSFITMHGFVKAATVRPDESTAIMRRSMFEAHGRELDFFTTVISHLKQKGVTPERWSIFYHCLEEEWLKANPAIFTQGNKLSQKEKADMSRRLDELIRKESTPEK